MVGGVALQAGFQPGFAILLGNAPADLPEQGVAHQRRAEGGFRAEREEVGLHGLFSERLDVGEIFADVFAVFA